MSSQDELTDLIASMPSAEPAEIAQAIRERFNLFKRAEKTPPTSEPAVGQLWRNKRSNRLVEIRFIDKGRDLAYWKIADDSRGAEAGQGWIQYWTGRFVYVGEAE